MSASKPAADIPVHETVGHVLPEWVSGVDAARQARYHAAADVDGALYGDKVDASVLANDCLHGARPRDALGATRLHAGVRVRQSAPIPLGAPLTVEARVDALAPAKRGRYIHIDFGFRRANGDVPVRIEHRSLILDPEIQPPNRAAAPKPPEPACRELRRVQLTPDMVSGYSFEFPHLEGHHDPAAAARIGMRAPIAQGLMGFTMLLAERMRLGGAESFDVEASFLRPIFWDEELSLQALGDREFRAVNPAGKPVSALAVRAWDRLAAERP